MPLDIRTIVATNIITDLALFIFMIMLWNQTRERFAGLGYIVINYLFQTIGMILLMLRDIIPDALSIVTSNLLVVSGIFIVYIGLGHFLGKRTVKTPNLVFLAVFTAIAGYFTFVHYDLSARTFNVSAGMFVMSLQCAWITLSRVNTAERRINLFLGLAFTGISIISIVRIVETALGLSPGNSYYRSGTFSAYVLISYEVLFILLTLGLLLMVTRRLITNTALQEEKFSKVFRSSPCIIILTKLSDGMIIDANDEFCKSTEYSPDEIRGKTTFDLRLWRDSDKRSEMIREITMNGAVHSRQISFMTKSGTVFTGLYSAELITINDEKFILASINDITELKKTEESLRKAYDEKHLLLRELQHRAKNSFSMIAGMISLAETNYGEGGESGILHDVSIRIRAISELYDLLYTTDSITDVRLDDYLTRIVAPVVRVSDNIELSESYDTVVMPVKSAISLGIIVTEILTNAVKYAFPGNRKGSLSFSLRKTDTGAMIEISDDGAGLPDNFDISTAHSLGFKLVLMIIKQIKGDYSLDGKNGTRWRISFPVD